jgi:hypothetical protein
MNKTIHDEIEQLSRFGGYLNDCYWTAYLSNQASIALGFPVALFPCESRAWSLFRVVVLGMNASIIPLSDEDVVRVQESIKKDTGVD